MTDDAASEAQPVSHEGPQERRMKIIDVEVVHRDEFYSTLRVELEHDGKRMVTLTDVREGRDMPEVRLKGSDGEFDPMNDDEFAVALHEALDEQCYVLGQEMIRICG